MKMKVSVVIPNWNGKHWLKICLPTLRRQTFKDFEVIVVDNGSSDGSEEYMRRFFPEFRVVRLKKNLGFAGGVNKGIEASVGENIVLVNNDMKLDKYFLKYLYESTKMKDVGLVAAKVLQYYHSTLIDSAGDYIDIVGHANNIGRGDKNGPEYDTPRKIFLVTGGACLIKREVFDRVGLFDEDYFAYFEDVDLSLRAQYAGFKAVYQPKAVVYHVHKGTSSKNRALLEYWQFRNMTMNIIKDFPDCVIWHKWNWLKILLVNIKTVQFFAKEGVLWSALRAEWYVLVHLPSLLAKRRVVQELIVVSPDYLRSIFVEKKINVPWTKWRF
jgi:GT2 family glycosyltransferase